MLSTSSKFRVPLRTGLGGGVVLACCALVVLPMSCKGVADECVDGIDNDNDGRVDFNDPGCGSSIQFDTAASDACFTADTSTGGLPVERPGCSISFRGLRESDDPECFDRIDNDEDGAIDLQDPGCVNFRDDDEANPECSDGVDNDGDNLIDYRQDPSCLGRASGTSEARRFACDDGLDNDGNGKIDYPADLGCRSPTDNSEDAPECSDGKDNDGDGATDYPADADCRTPTAGREAAYACGDGVDNDRDGAIDFPADVGCASKVDDSEMSPQCADGRDNDGDGLVDFVAAGGGDPGCAAPRDNTEAQAQCADGYDNDGDGRTDYPDDPGCGSKEDNSEFDGTCADGIDNDGDTFTDFPDDPDCGDATGFEGSVVACADGLDNDGDGFIDFPADPDCTGRNDNTERKAEGDCDDGKDNDGDGLIDRYKANLNVGDPACIAGRIWERLDPECADRLDNDDDKKADTNGVDFNNDGVYDLPGEFPPDPACAGAGTSGSSLNGRVETDKPQCADGKDNDGDGKTDYPADVACTSESGRDEAAVPQCDDNVDNDGDNGTDYEPEFLDNKAPNPAWGDRDLDCDDIFDNLEDGSPT